jgi:hypothetical protein
VQITYAGGANAAYIDLSFDSETVTQMPTGPTGPQGPAGPGIRGLVSALPTSPQDGDECYFQSAAMATDGVIWHLRYRAASASYKWEFLGGSPLLSTATATLSLSNGWLAYPTGQLAVPLTGQYRIGQSAEVQLPSVQQVACGYAVNSAIDTGNSQTAITAAPAGPQFLSRQNMIATLSAGQNLQWAFYIAGTGVVAALREMTMIPIRVG